MAKLPLHIYAFQTQVLSDNLTETQREAINDPFRVTAAHGRLTAGAGSFDTPGNFTATDSNAVLVMDLRLKPGVRLPTMRSRITGVIGQGITMSLHKITDGVLGAAIGQDVSVGGGLQDLAIINQVEDMPELGVALGEMYTLAFTVTGAGFKVHTIEVDTAVVP